MGMEKSFGVKSDVRKLTYCAMLIALSGVGAMIKIQGSIAFDSMPGFFAALFIGPGAGAIVAGLGHLLSAMTSGFPLTMAMHLVVALEMALFGYIFGWTYKKSNGVIACIVAIFLNGPVAALLAVPTSIVLALPFNGWNLFKVVIVPLTVASGANVILGYMLFKVLKRRMNQDV